MTKISILGDSISKGVVFDNSDKKYKTIKFCYANLIKDKYNVEILNYSKFGCTSTKALKILEWNKEKVSSSLYTLIELGGNDCDHDWTAISENPDLPHFPKTGLEEFSDNFLKIINTTKSYGSIPVILNLPPINAQRYFAKFSENKNENNLLEFLNGDKQFVYRWHEAYNLRVTKLAIETNSLLFDIRTPFLTNRNAGDLICKDGIHPSQQGHEVIAKSLEEFAQKFLTHTGKKETA